MPTHPSQAPQNHSPTKPVHQLKSVNSRSSQLRLATVFDQHRSDRFPRGRPWWGHLEKPADSDYDPAFCSELLPGDTDDPFGSTWGAPWLPAQLATDRKRYFRVDTISRKLTWLYSSIIADDVAANELYWEAAFKIAHEHGWAMPNENEPPTFQIRAILLEPPRSPRIAQAALAGDPWVLGQSDEVNEELQALLTGKMYRHDTPKQAIVTPEQVLSADPGMQALVAKLVAEALSAIEAQKSAAKNAKMAKVRSARKQTAPKLAGAA